MVYIYSRMENLCEVLIITKFQFSVNLHILNATINYIRTYVITLRNAEIAIMCVCACVCALET